MEKMKLRQLQSENWKALRKQLRPLSEKSLEKAMKDKCFFSKAKVYNVHHRLL